MGGKIAKDGAPFLRGGGEIANGGTPFDGPLPREDGVAALDVVEGAEDGFGRNALAVDFEMPLEVADPQDKLGDGGGARVQLDAEELVGVDGVGPELEPEVFPELSKWARSRSVVRGRSM